MKRKNFSVIELMVVIVVIMILIALVGPMIQKLLINAKRAQAFNNLKNIVVAMRDYAASDTKKSRMPYPVAKGAMTPMPKWGDDAACWSPEIVKMLFKNHNLEKGNENILSSPGVTGDDYEPMLMTEDLDAKGNANKMRWEKDTELYFHVYASKSLTDAASGNMVMGITYDQPDINNCLFKGEGWVVFFMSGEGGWKKRKQFVNYDFDSETENKISAYGSPLGLAEAQKITSTAAIRAGAYAVKGSGGSSEVIGMKSTSAIYRGFVVED